MAEEGLIGAGDEEMKAKTQEEGEKKTTSLKVLTDWSCLLFQGVS